MAEGKLSAPSIFVDTDITSSGNVTIGAKSQGTFTVPLSKSGYNLVGIVTLAKSGGGNGDCVITSFFPSNGAAQIGVYNMADASRTISVQVRGIYKKV